MSQTSAEALEQSISRNAAAVLSLPSAGMLRNCKTRFLGQSDKGIWLEADIQQRSLIDQLIAEGTRAGISFRGGTLRVAFTVRILLRQQDFRISDSAAVEAILVEKPEELKAIQRRHSYRVRVHDDSDVRVRIWRIPEHSDIKDEPQAVQEIPNKLRNLSAGGIGAILEPAPDRPLNLSVDDRLRIALSTAGTALILEGRVRHPARAAKDPAKAQYFGIQFSQLENNIEGRQSLAFITSILGELERAEARRSRLGVA